MDAMPIFFNATGVRQRDCRRLPIGSSVFRPARAPRMKKEK
jgi:hypothetical protein